MRADAVRNRARILDAAADVFARSGAAASTEEVAEVAGVAVGTVFRHFPTKRDLLAAILKDLLATLNEQAETATLFEFFASVVELSAERRAVVELLAVDVARSVGSLPVDELLARAQKDNTVRADVRADEVRALLTAASQGALHGNWDADLRKRTLEVIFAGLRPSAGV